MAIVNVQGQTGGGGAKVETIELTLSASATNFTIPGFKKIYSLIWRVKGSTSNSVAFYAADGTTWLRADTSSAPTYPVSAGSFCNLNSLGALSLNYTSGSVIPEIYVVGE